jgi:hypothetical protein
MRHLHGLGRPLNGTWLNSTFAIRANSIIARCGIVAVPGWP